MNKRMLLCLLAFVGMSHLSQAQKAEDSVKATINQLFEGMKSANASMVQGAFADSAVLQTIITRNREGRTVIRNEQVSAFADFVGKQKAGAADERIQFETIRIDGPLAIVWTPYKFYFNGSFSHCGVNSFQLVRLNGQWKIQYLIDTRRKEPCE
ncbi:nuclear transport factor 2 family protein [Paraflavitalea pollutisoli]|uniref:nuclear transport factor 2 family protein n=1 Tax=Paraflavitalea pollutisoli TaxID=3034143 RepID=UPI0023EDDB80|nr:nuclear transport factor 2 family protein [Paraflavitalea sp. H1-2-19X]